MTSPSKVGFQSAKYGSQRLYESYAVPSMPLVPSWSCAPKYGTYPSNVWPSCCTRSPKKKMGYRVEDLIAPSDPHTHCSNHYRRDHHQIPFTVSYDAVVCSASVPTSSPAVLPRIVATQIIIPPQTTTSFHPPSQAFHSTPVVADCTRVSHPSPYVCRTINYQQLPLTSQAISDRHPEANTLQDFRSSVPPMSAVIVRPSNQERRTNSPTHYRRRMRVKFTQKQLKTMNEEFDKKSYINKKERRELSKILGVSETQIKNFWQNKRMKAKQQKLQLKKKVTEEKTQVS